MVQYLQENGLPWTKAAFEAMFGPVEVHERAGATYRLVAIRGRWDSALTAEQALIRAEQARKSDDPAGMLQSTAACIVTVTDRNGVPLADVPVVWSWSTAPADPSLGWYGRGVIGPTNAEGLVGLAMGHGAYYQANQEEHGPIGPHSVWIRGEASDMVNGIGMLWATNHYHPDLYFQEGSEVEDGETRYYDAQGNEQSLYWAETMFGPQDIHRAAGFPVYRLAELRAGEGDDRTLSVMVLDENGSVPMKHSL